jgi:transposase
MRSNAVLNGRCWWSPCLRLPGEIDQRATHDARVDVLRQIYGIGRYLGMLIVAELGEIERFPTTRHLCAWAGLHSSQVVATPAVIARSV